MGEIDAKTLDEATRRYTGIRRRYWQFSLGVLAAIIVFPALEATLDGLGPRVHPDLRGFLIAPMVLAFFVCCAGSVVKWLTLMRFRCPNCGKKFILSSSSSWPTSACKHCGLHLVAEPPRRETCNASLMTAPGTPPSEVPTMRMPSVRFSGRRMILGAAIAGFPFGVWTFLTGLDPEVARVVSFLAYPLVGLAIVFAVHAKADPIVTARESKPYNATIAPDPPEPK